MVVFQGSTHRNVQITNEVNRHNNIQKTIFKINYPKKPLIFWSFIKRQTSDNRKTTSDNKWYNEWQRKTTSDDEWQRVVGTTNENEWYNERQWVATSDKEWQRVTTTEISE